MPSPLPRPVRTIVIATDAGHAGTVLMATQLARQLPPGVEILHCSVDSLPRRTDVVLAHTRLADRVARDDNGRVLVVYEKPVGDPAIKDLAEAITAGWPAPCPG